MSEKAKWSQNKHHSGFILNKCCISLISSLIALMILSPQKGSANAGPTSFPSCVSSALRQKAGLTAVEDLKTGTIYVIGEVPVATRINWSAPKGSIATAGERSTPNTARLDAKTGENIFINRDISKKNPNSFFVARGDEPVYAVINIQKKARQELLQFKPSFVQQKVAELRKKSTAVDSLIRWPFETVKFFFALGAVAYTELWLHYAKSPAAVEQWLEGPGDPIGHLGFYAFVYSNAKCGRLLAPLTQTMSQWGTTGKMFRHIFGYVGMTCGSIASSIVHEIGYFPKLKECALGGPNALSKNLITSPEQNALDCDEAYQTWLDMNKEEKFHNDMAPSIISLITSTMTAGIAEWGICGVLAGASSLKEIGTISNRGKLARQLILGADLLLNLVPGKPLISGVRWAITEIPKFYAFLAIDTIIKEPVNYLWHEKHRTLPRLEEVEFHIHRLLVDNGRSDKDRVLKDTYAGEGSTPGPLPKMAPLREDFYRKTMQGFHEKKCESLDDYLDGIHVFPLENARLCRPDLDILLEVYAHLGLRWRQTILGPITAAHAQWEDYLIRLIESERMHKEVFEYIFTIVNKYPHVLTQKMPLYGVKPLDANMNRDAAARVYTDALNFEKSQIANANSVGKIMLEVLQEMPSSMGAQSKTGRSEKISFGALQRVNHPLSRTIDVLLSEDNLSDTFPDSPSERSAFSRIKEDLLSFDSIRLSNAIELLKNRVLAKAPKRTKEPQYSIQAFKGLVFKINENFESLANTVLVSIFEIADKNKINTLDLMNSFQVAQTVLGDSDKDVLKAIVEFFLSDKILNSSLSDAKKDKPELMKLKEDLSSNDKKRIEKGIDYLRDKLISKAPKKPAGQSFLAEELAGLSFREKTTEELVRNIYRSLYEATLRTNKAYDEKLTGSQNIVNNLLSQEPMTGKLLGSPELMGKQLTSNQLTPVERIFLQDIATGLTSSEADTIGYALDRINLALRTCPVQVDVRDGDTSWGDLCRAPQNFSHPDILPKYRLQKPVPEGLSVNTSYVLKYVRSVLGNPEPKYLPGQGAVKIIDDLVFRKGKIGTPLFKVDYVKPLEASPVEKAIVGLMTGKIPLKDPYGFSKRPFPQVSKTKGAHTEELQLVEWDGYRKPYYIKSEMDGYRARFAPPRILYDGAKVTFIPKSEYFTTRPSGIPSAQSEAITWFKPLDHFKIELSHGSGEKSQIFSYPSLPFADLKNLHPAVLEKNGETSVFWTKQVGTEMFDAWMDFQNKYRDIVIDLGKSLQLGLVGQEKPEKEGKFVGLSPNAELKGPNYFQKYVKLDFSNGFVSGLQFVPQFTYDNQTGEPILTNGGRPGVLNLMLSELNVYFRVIQMLIGKVLSGSEFKEIVNKIGVCKDAEDAKTPIEITQKFKSCKEALEKDPVIAGSLKVSQGKLALKLLFLELGVSLYKVASLFGDFKYDQLVKVSPKIMATQPLRRVTISRIDQKVFDQESKKLQSLIEKVLLLLKGHSLVIPKELDEFQSDQSRKAAADILTLRTLEQVRLNVSEFEGKILARAFQGIAYVATEMVNYLNIIQSVSYVKTYGEETYIPIGCEQTKPNEAPIGTNRRFGVSGVEAGKPSNIFQNEQNKKICVETSPAYDN